MNAAQAQQAPVKIKPATDDVIARLQAQWRQSVVKTAAENKAEENIDELEVGTRMADGAIFAGISPDTELPIFVAPADEEVLLSFDKAQERAVEKSEEEGREYRVPSASELKMIFNSRAAIGGLNLTGDDPEGFYWSSTEVSDVYGRCQCFSNGQLHSDLRTSRNSVRLVRS